MVSKQEGPNQIFVQRGSASQSSSGQNMPLTSVTVPPSSSLSLPQQQYQAFGGQQFSRKTCTMVAGLTNTLKIVDTNINQSKVVRGTVRHHLIEAEKEAQRLRCVQANRESTRQTIRRRQ
ncbi:uncharacterized protein [Henckelia pumila]